MGYADGEYTDQDLSKWTDIAHMGKILLPAYLRITCLQNSSDDTVTAARVPPMKAS